VRTDSTRSSLRPLYSILSATISLLLSYTITYAPPAQAAYFPVSREIPIADQINQVALQYGISSTTLDDIVRSESMYDPNAIGDHGCSRGLVQLNLCAHSEITPEEASSTQFSLNWAAQDIKADKEDSDFAGECSCVTYLRSIGVNLPSVSINASDLAHAANTYPHVGVVVIFRYPSGEYHVALIKSIAPDGNFVVAEANYHRCLIDTREVSPTDPSIIGYWSASQSP